MLILLQPGIQPLGQFDIEDNDIDLVVGGEVVIFNEFNSSDTYAADVSYPGPQTQILLGAAGYYKKVGLGKQGYIWGFADDGSSSGLYGKGYGTMFGQVIGAAVGQGTGLSNKGAVTVGPHTTKGSGKVTVWDKPGLYGVTKDAFTSTGYSDSLTPNTALYGWPSNFQAMNIAPPVPNRELRGKLASSAPGSSALPGIGFKKGIVGYSLGAVSDTSFVSTPRYYAGASEVPIPEYIAIYQVRKK
jgi:hypothetical protein